MTLNVRGLRNARKRKIVFEFLLSCYFDICLIQKAHLRDERDVVLFCKEWRAGVLGAYIYIVEPAPFSDHHHQVNM